MDLNLTRVHRMTRSTLGASAAYVCNFPGPDFYHDDVVHAQGVVDPDAVDLAITNAQSNLNPLACVAIDYGAFVNAQQQRVMRFLVFDPVSGNLLPALDLDGRGKKQIPNACSACHGIPFEANPPSASYQTPNGGRYVPFDEGSLVFSRASGLTRHDQEGAIKFLNQMILDVTTDQLNQAGQGAQLTSDPIYQLIHSWYDTQPCTSPPQGVMTSPTQAVLPLPCGLASATLEEQDAYWALYAPYCRSCHVSNGVLSFKPPTALGALKSLFLSGQVCKPLTGNPRAVMPSSKVSFDRLWTSHLGPTAVPFSDFDYPYFLSQFAGCSLDSFPPAIH